MKKVKIKAGFRYNVEAVVNADDDWRMLFTKESEEEAKQEILEDLNFEFDVDEDGTGAISDWKFEAEEVKE